MLILDAHNVAALRERWVRASALGVRADSDAYPVGTTDSDLALRRDRLGELFREERALLHPIAEQLAERALLTLVADPDGVILSSHGGGEFTDPAARVRLVEGARWSEDARGTNAIGTAITERRAVAVLGAAHYEKRNHGLFCYAAPVRDAYGELVAVLDVTGPMTAHDAAVGVAVQAAGAALERALRAMAYARAGAGALAAIERLVHRCAGPALLVEATGAVRVRNAAACAALGVDDDAALSCERLFGLPYGELSALALAGARGMRFETRAATYRVELDPVPGTTGRTLAVLVHLEADSARVPAPHATATQRAPASVAHASAADAPPGPRAPAPRSPAFDAILSADPAVDRARDDAQTFARTTLPVLLLAETGTGKELFARAIHGASARARGPFVALNCGALAPSLLESELFGYAPGAFTGAARTGSEGRIAAAHGGTLFLDEIAEMPAALQAALLRVLDDGVYQRVGEARPRRADFRLVCATCRDLPALVTTGAFRRDLFYRIHGACVTIPPLRARRDREWLAEQLLARSELQPAPRLDDDARAWLREHDWPGNVRELKSALTHASALSASTGVVTRSHFPRVLLSSAALATGAGDVRASGAPRTREQILHDAIADAMRACQDNVTEAARRLGVARSTVYRVLRGRKG